MKPLRAQASLEALLVLLLMLLLLQILGLSIQVFHSDYRLVFLDSAERQSLAAHALVLGAQICDIGVHLPLDWYPDPSAGRGYLFSARNASINQSILGAPIYGRTPA